MLERNHSTKGAIIVDSRYAPLVVSSFIGEQVVKQGLWFEQTLQRALREIDGRVVCIYDASRSTRTNPEMRRFWADLSKRNESLHGRVVNLVVITNPMVRGVLTAIGWLNPRVAELDVYPSLDTAVDAARELLATARTPTKLPREGYRLPEMLNSAC